MTGVTLVTGAQGLVGRYAVAELLKRGETVVGTGRSPRNDSCFTHHLVLAGETYAAPLPPELDGSAASSDYSRCDLADPDAATELVRTVAPTRILHVAGALHGEGQPALQRCNIDATTHLVRAAAALPRAPLFVFCSSGAVFGDQPCLPITEDAQPNPIGDYARSKLEAERVASRIAGASGMPLVIARIFNVIGPGLQPRHLPAYLAHRIAEIELLACEPVIEIGSLTTTRDLVDVRDVAVVLARLGRGSPDVFNIASGRETPMRDVAWRLAKMSTRDISFQLRTGRSKVGADRIVAVIGAMRRIGVEPRPLAASLEDMLAYARSAAARHADRILNPL